MSIYICNLSYDVTEYDLMSIFEEYGNVNKVIMPKDRETGEMRGFAFVEMYSEEEELKAIESLDRAELMGRTLKVDKARPREPRKEADETGKT